MWIVWMLPNAIAVDGVPWLQQRGCENSGKYIAVMSKYSGAVLPGIHWQKTVVAQWVLWNCRLNKSGTKVVQKTGYFWKHQQISFLTECTHGRLVALREEIAIGIKELTIRKTIPWTYLMSHPVSERVAYVIYRLKSKCRVSNRKSNSGHIGLCADLWEILLLFCTAN